MCKPRQIHLIFACLISCNYMFQQFIYCINLIFLNTQEMTSFNSQPKYYILFPGMTWFPEPNSGDANHVTWLEDGISWYFSYSGDSGQTQARKQYNTLGKTYSYVAATW